MVNRYYIKNVYGIETMYIVDQDQSWAITLISGKKTLTLPTKDGLEMIGFKFIQVLPPVLSTKK